MNLRVSLVIFSCMIVLIDCHDSIRLTRYNNQDYLIFFPPTTVHDRFQSYSGLAQFGPQPFQNNQYSSQQQAAPPPQQYPTEREIQEATSVNTFRPPTKQPTTKSPQNNLQQPEQNNIIRPPPNQKIEPQSSQERIDSNPSRPFNNQQPQRPTHNQGFLPQINYNPVPNHSGENYRPPPPPYQNGALPNYNPVPNQSGENYRTPPPPYQNGGQRPQYISVPENNYPHNNQRPVQYNGQTSSTENSGEKFENYKPISNFAWQLFKTSNSPLTPNMVMCPLSPQLLLSYICAGSDGETHSQIRNSIQYSNPRQLENLMRSMLTEGSNRELQFATAFFVANNFHLNPRFASNDVVEVFPTDFRHPQKFSNAYNQWANQKTKGALAVTPVRPDPSTKMLMSSAVYFKGNWIYKFNPASNGEFFSNGGRRNVPMMSLKKKLPYGTVDDMAEWISIPYNSTDCMVLILPRSGILLESVINRIDNSHVDRIMNSISNDNYANVNLTMPKFKIDSTNSLVKPMQQMGMQKMFTENTDVTKLTANKEPVQISNCMQQASMEVNEEGSIASSLTTFSVVALSYSPPTPDIEFLVNRPFIAMICDRNRNFPYFIAKVSSP